VSTTSRDRKILMTIAALALVAGYWFFALSPKLDEAKEAAARVTEQKERLATAQTELADLERAKASYASDYATVVRLGKAIPTGVDTASLMIQLQKAANGTNISFSGIQAGERTAPVAAPPKSLGSAAASSTGTQPAGAQAPPQAKNESEKQAVNERQDALNARENTPAARQAAEQAAADQTEPLTAAGLEPVPLEFTFDGSFFDLADFFHEMKRYVEVANQKIAVSGRLLTIDKLSFEVKPEFPHIQALVNATAYVSEKRGGVTAGATAEGPAPVEGQPAKPTEQAEAPTTVNPTPTASVQR
jgi:hypothetical protein